VLLVVVDGVQLGSGVIARLSDRSFGIPSSVELGIGLELDFLRFRS
jgi:hypothetical protein